MLIGISGRIRLEDIFTLKLILMALSDTVAEFSNLCVFHRTRRGDEC